MKLVSVLIPTRKRLRRLVQSIDSIYGTANPANFDIWLRVDSDDFDTILGLHYLLKLRHEVNVLIKPRGLGYEILHEYYTELSECSDASWIFILNDDITLEGGGWDEQLRRIPIHGVIVQPEIYHLGLTIYGRGSAGACPLVPNGCWKQFIGSQLPNPVDFGLDKLLKLENGWRLEILNGLTINHQRDNDTVLAEHKRL